MFGWDYPALRACWRRAVCRTSVFAATRVSRRRRGRTQRSTLVAAAVAARRRRVMADKQLEATIAAAAFQKAVVRRAAPPRLRRAAAVRDRAGRRAVRAVRSRSTCPPSAISGGRRSSPPNARRPAISTRWTADGFTRDLCRYCSLGFASTRYRDAQAAALGRAADAAAAVRAADLRLHPARLRAVGGGVRHRALRDRQPGRQRSAAALVGARSARVARARRAAPARVRRRRRSSGSSSDSRRSAAARSIATRCASGWRG